MYVTLLLLAINTIDTMWVEENIDSHPIILPKLGLAMSQKGVAVLEAETTMISVFIKIKKPGIKFIKGFQCTEQCTKAFLATLVWPQNCFRENMKVMPEPEKAYKTISDVNMRTCANECITDIKCQGLTLKNTVCVLRKEKTYVTAPSTGDSELKPSCLEQFRAEIEKRCGDSFITNIENTIKKEVDEHWMDHKRSFDELQQIKNSLPTKKKRGIAATAIPIIGSMVTSGLFLWEVYKAKAHIEKVEQKFNEFKKQEQHYEEQTILYEKELVKVIHNMDDKYTQYINQLDCTMRVSVLLELWVQMALSSWQKKMDDVFTHVSSGTLTGRPITAIIDRKLITKIIENNDKLNNSVYAKNTLWPLDNSLLTMVQATEENETYSIHYILTIPTFKKDNIHPLYTIEHTGFKENNTCLSVVTPKNVVKKSGKYFPFELSSSQKLGSFYFSLQLGPETQQEIMDSQLAPCINNNTNSCLLKPIPCDTKTIYTRAGLLVRTDEEILAVVRSGKDLEKVIKVQNTDNTVHFLGWDNFVKIQIGSQLIDGINTEIYADVDMIDLDEKWQELINHTLSRQMSINTSMLQSIIQEQMKIITESNYNEDLKNKLGMYVAYTSMALWIMFLAYVVGRKIQHFIVEKAVEIKEVKEMYNLRRKKRKLNTGISMDEPSKKETPRENINEYQNAESVIRRRGSISKNEYMPTDANTESSLRELEFNTRPKSIYHAPLDRQF